VARDELAGSDVADTAKKVVWTGLVALASALSAALAVRALDAVWRRVTHEAPPGMPRWTRLVLANPVKRRVTRRIQPDTL
jgi:hypothetical protein